MPTDFLGNPIAAGDTIVYPVRQGSSMWLNKAEVLEVSFPTADGPRVRYTLSIVRDDGRRAQITKLNRVIVVEKKNATV